MSSVRALKFRLLSLCLALVAAIGAASATHADERAPVFHAEGNPKYLSEWNILTVTPDRLSLHPGVVPYDLNTPLFTDYAHKLRTIWMPQGTSARYRERDVFDFPVGTIISKTFYYPVPDGAAKMGGTVFSTDDRIGQRRDGGLDLARLRLMETRLLVRREEGWIALPYVWNKEQTRARLKRAGDLAPLTMAYADGSMEKFIYAVPNQNQCKGCHAPDSNTKALSPIGPKPRHMNRPFDYADGTRNQIAYLTAAGYLTGAPAPASAPQNASWTDHAAGTEARARAYLDINCSHCHNTVGAADTSGLHLEPFTPEGPHLGICKLPIAAGSGTGGRRFGIVPGKPEESIFIYRMATTKPGAMMPELGRALVHHEGVELVEKWIEGLAGDCG